MKSIGSISCGGGVDQGSDICSPDEPPPFEMDSRLRTWALSFLEISCSPISDVDALLKCAKKHVEVAVSGKGDYPSSTHYSQRTIRSTVPMKR